LRSCRQHRDALGDAGAHEIPHGGALQVVRQMTGHKSRSVFERYNIVSVGDLREAGRRLDVVAGTIGQNSRSGTKS
jgi:hypothetical protein